jgi:hypothetical protein
LACIWPPSQFSLLASAAETCGSRRLPGITQRDASLLAFDFVYTRTIELHHAGLFAGAACCNISWADGTLERMSRGRQIRAKAAPLRALGTNIPFERANLVENEDEDDYEAPRRGTRKKSAKSGGALLFQSISSPLSIQNNHRTL